jgi:general secretion pathway protein I
LRSNRADRRARGRALSAGFTLFEVVVALAIAALGLGLLLSAVSTGLGNSAVANQYTEATRRAQSHLAQLGVLEPLTPGVRSGDDGRGYSWQTRISLPIVHAGLEEGDPGLGLYTIEVSIGWQTGGQTKTVSLQSLRLGPP